MNKLVKSKGDFLEKMRDPTYNHNSSVTLSVRNSILYVCDCILSLFIIPVASITTWVSVHYIVRCLPNEFWMPILIAFCIVLHSASHLCCKFIYRFIREHVTAPTTFYIVSRIYLYLFAFASIIIYGAVPDQYSDSISFIENFYLNVALVSISYLILLSIRCRPHIVSLGGEYGESTPEEVFLFPYRFFKFSWKKNKCLYIFDSLFSVSVVGILVIVVWQGAWIILDEIIYNDNDKISAWISLVLGYMIILMGIPLKTFIKTVIREYSNWSTLIILDLYLLFSFFGSINIWRGYWMLIDTNLFESSSLLTCVTYHFISFFILVIFNASNTLIVRGVYMDTKGKEDEFLDDFPCYHFRKIFQEKDEMNWDDSENKRRMAKNSVEHINVGDSDNDNTQNKISTHSSFDRSEFNVPILKEIVFDKPDYSVN